MKETEDGQKFSDAFGTFAAKYSKSVWDEVLKSGVKLLAIRTGNQSIGAKVSGIRAKFSESCGSGFGGRKCEGFNVGGGSLPTQTSRYFRDGPKANMAGSNRDVRFTPNSGRDEPLQSNGSNC
jgi:hypothetical protein